MSLPTSHFENLELRRTAARVAKQKALERNLTAINTLNHEANTLKLLAKWIAGKGAETFSTVVDKIMATTDRGGRIITTNVGKTGHVCKKVAATLASTGTPAQFVHATEASHGDLGMVTRNDLVIAISTSGETKELADIIAHTRRFDIPLVAITRNPASTLGQAADYVLQIPDVEEGCINNQAPMASTTHAMALGDALANQIMARRGFTKENFKQFHPGGKLGAQLVRTSELMVRDDLPLVAQDAPMKDTLAVMRRVELGIVGIAGEQGLIGVITQGSAVRFSEREDFTNWNGVTAGQVMTLNPKTIPADSLAVEAVKEMQDTRVNVLFAMDPADPAKPVGVLHIQQCMRAGLA